MTNQFTIEVQLSTRNEPVEIEVTTEYAWENDGIGSYEYWGSRGYDRGNDYVAIEDWKWDKTGYTTDEVLEIDAAIESKLPDWETSIAENYEPECYEPEPEYDIDWDEV